MAPPERDKPPIDSRVLGLIVIAVILLVIILLRWGRYLPWSLR